MEIIQLDLKNTKGEHFYYIKDDNLIQKEKDLESLIDEEKHLNKRSFAKKVLLSHELQANNEIEGIKDDLSVIRTAINNIESIKNEATRKRIINLYNAYNFILDEPQINETTLKQLYLIISKDLLEREDQDKMGEFYRREDVYILKNGRLDASHDKGIEPSKIEKWMDMYFNFLNSFNVDSRIDEYIKSQIMHYFFVYIHPFIDVNGRTSRTLSIWYLLNKEIYPYIIFNRGIALNKTGYDRKISLTGKTKNLSMFLNMMLDAVYTEVQKEYVMNIITESISYDLDSIDYQNLLFYLSIRSEKNLKNFKDFYNRQTGQSLKCKEIKQKLSPLIDKGILYLTGKEHNPSILLNDFEIDRTKTKSLRF